MTNPVQPLDPSGVPSPLTPADSPSDPSGYAGVTPHGQGPAPYNIQAPMEDLSAVASSAQAQTGGGEGAPTGAGFGDMSSPRQQQTAALLQSPQGFGAFSITAGMSGGGGEDWPSDVNPGANAETPDQGMGDFTGTGTD